jgi:predicted phosphodiesterase
MKQIKKIMCTAIAIGILGTTSLTTLANSDDKFSEANMTTEAWANWATKWETIKSDLTKISLTPGKNASELNLAWYSSSSVTEIPNVKLAKKSEMNGTSFPQSAKVFSGASSSAVAGYNTNKVTLTGLEENTEYMYSYSNGSNWSSPISYTTRSTKNFKLLYVGDPQIGSSNSNISSIDNKILGEDRACRNDAYNWNNTLTTALNNNPNVSFIISAGDQIQSSNKDPLSTINEIEYTGFLSPSILKSLPVATTIGNHDSKNSNYSFHFNNPNASNLGTTSAGGDYYYSYGDALFITLNSNNTNTAEHDSLIKKAISETPNAKWRIVTFHHDIYGTGAPHSESDGKALRPAFSKIIDDNHIDVVLQGHDHTYSRTFQLLRDQIKPTNLQDGKAINPEGTLYMTACSATGSKYYDLYPTQQSYIAARWQGDVPTYSTMDINEVSFTINTFRADNNEKIDSSYTIVKSLNKTNLNDLIVSAENKLSNKDTITASSLNNLSDSLKLAKEISQKADATSDEISNAYKSLTNSINSLEAKGDTKALNEALKNAENLLNSLPEGTTKENLKALTDETKSLLSSGNATEGMINDVLSRLQKAIASDTPKPSNSNTTTPLSTQTSSTKTSTAKTGDNFTILPVIFTCLSILGIGSTIYCGSKKRHTLK